MTGITNTTTSSTTQMAPPPSRDEATPTISNAAYALSSLDVTEKVFKQLLIQRDVRTIQALGCTNKAISENIDSLKQQTCFVDTAYLQDGFSDVRILDTNILSTLQLYEKFHINEFSLVKGINDLPSQIEGDAGVSILVMRKGTTLGKIMAYAGSGEKEEDRMRISFYPEEILTELCHHAVEETYVVLITNNIFKNCRYLDSTEHSEIANKYQCELPTALEYIGLIVLTRKIFNICLYGQDPGTYWGFLHALWGISLVYRGLRPGPPPRRPQRWFWRWGPRRRGAAEVLAWSANLWCSNWFFWGFGQSRQKNGL